MPDPVEFESFEYEDFTKLTKDSRALGNYVLAENLDDEREKIIGGILIPQRTAYQNDNYKLKKAKITSVGSEAAKEGVEVGMIILYDLCSAFYRPGRKPGRIICTHVENVIAIVEE